MDADVLRGARRIAVIVVVVGVAIAAAIGIAVIVGGIGDQWTWRILGTALIAALLGTVVLVELALVARIPLWIAWCVIGLGVVAAIGSIALLWGALDALSAAGYDAWESQNYSGDEPWQLELAYTISKLVWLAAIVTGFSVVASLVLIVRRHRHPVVRVALIVTLALLTALPILIGWLMLAEPDVGEWFGRGMSVLGILAALGVVATPVLAAVLRGGVIGSGDAAPVELGHLSHGSIQSLRERAAAEGTTPDELVERLLGYLRPIENSADR